MMWLSNLSVIMKMLVLASKFCTSVLYLLLISDQ